MAIYHIEDPEDHLDQHRGYVNIDGMELGIHVTSCSLRVSLADENAGKFVGSFGMLFTEIIDMLKEAKK